MRHYLSETVERVKGNRKCGVDVCQMLFAKDDVLEQKFTATPFEIPECIDLAFENFINQNQGNTPYCVAFSIAHALTFFLTAKYHERITIEGRFIANLLINAGILTKQGARIDEAVEYITSYSQTDGIHDVKGQKYVIKEFKTYSRALIPKILMDGYPIVSGALIKYPMTDSDDFLIPASTNNTVGGHAFMLPPTRRLMTYFFGENSWKNFGIKYASGLPSGQFKIKKEHTSRLFTPHVFTKVEKV